MIQSENGQSRVQCAQSKPRGQYTGERLPGAKYRAIVDLAAQGRKIDRIARELNHNEDDAGLPETRAPDPGFVPYLHDWASGHDLADVLESDEEMTGGDFVRHVKQCIDLLRQVADVAPKPATADAARVAAEACFRGVVAASSVVGR